MSNMNQCNFIGRMGKDIELRTAQTGMAVGKVSIAVSEKRKGEETTQWVNLIFFGKAAELMQQYTAKGALIRVSAKYQNRKYEQDGQTKYMTEFLVNDFEFLSTGKQQGGQGGQQNHEYQPSQRPFQKGGYPGGQGGYNPPQPPAPSNIDRNPQPPLYDDQIPF